MQATKDLSAFKKNLVRLSILLFALSLTQKAYCTATQCSDSIMVLLLGWAGLTSGISGIAWFANPLLIASWLMLRRNLTAGMFMSIGAALLAMSFLVFDTVATSESGHTGQVTNYKAGYWLWMGSTFCMLAASFYLKLMANREAMRQRPKPNEYLH
ncbi:MAG: hypothetical protein KGO82_18645 [Bacteroidota bacterium]|nr:hypothetical protein [Bacteroidota bacterium]